MWELISNPSDHPLASMKSARKLLASLPHDDTTILLQEISHWVATITEPENEFKLSHQLELLCLLDESTHPYLNMAVNNYFAVQTLSVFQSNSLWSTLAEYYTRCAYAYLSVFKAYRNGAKKSSAIKSQMPLVIARAMHALAGSLKLAAVRYTAGKPEVWSSLAELYAYAEAQKFLDEPIALYHDAVAGASIRNILAGISIWQACGESTLQPQQIHVAECIIRYLEEYLSITDKYNGASLLTFDLMRGKPPARINREATVHPGMRFIGVSEAPRQLHELIDKLEKGVIPSELDLNAQYAVSTVLEVARQLSRSVSNEPPARRNPRRKLNVNMCVASGLSMLDEISAHTNMLCDTGESWVTEDISVNGFLCVMPADKERNVKIGDLIGLQPEKVGRWGAGIVQRLSHDSKNNLLIGVEMLSNQITGVILQDRQAKPGSKFWEQRALYLNRPETRGEEAWLLMKPDSFSSRHSLAMSMDDSNYLLMPLELIRQGEDFILARYKQMAQYSKPGSS